MIDDLMTSKPMVVLNSLSCGCKTNFMYMNYLIDPVEVGSFNNFKSQTIRAIGCVCAQQSYHFPQFGEFCVYMKSYPSEKSETVDFTLYSGYIAASFFFPTVPFSFSISSYKKIKHEYD
jgi:hypothetical protein